MAYFNRFDICEAYYLFLSEHYAGMGDDMYSRLCKMQKYFSPRYNLCWDDLSKNAKEIYHNLAMKHINYEYDIESNWEWLEICYREDEESTQCFDYGDYSYDIADFTKFEKKSRLGNYWDGYLSLTAFSVMLIKVNKTGESVIVGHTYS